MSLPEIFAEAAARRVFPGGVVYSARGDEITAHAGFGMTAYEDEISRPVLRETIYDLASVSKIFTLTAFLIAKRQTNIGENETVGCFLPDFARGDKSAITLRHLMMHSAGFGFHLQRLQNEPCESWIEKIAAAPLESAPGEKVNYTCTAYFLLARVIEKLSGERADVFIERELLAPLQLSHSGFNLRERFSTDEIAPTEISAATGQPWHGIVHDEAARQWHLETGGFAGNAGLFSTALDVARFCRLWLSSGEEILHPDDVQAAFSDTQLEDDTGGVYRGWGWQIGNKTYQGEHGPSGSAGHQGFTGPTFFINPQTRDMVIVLNNRVYPTRNGPARFVYHRRVAREHFLKIGEAS